jgi:hypothetical protein
MLPVHKNIRGNKFFLIVQIIRDPLVIFPESLDSQAKI